MAGFGVPIASLPLVSILAILWLWRDTGGDAALVARHAQATLWFVIPSLPFFLILPGRLDRGTSFWHVACNGQRRNHLPLPARDLDRRRNRYCLIEDKPMRLALFAAALFALAGCASTPPLAAPEQQPSAQITTDGCGNQPVRILKSSVSPRLVIYRACKAQARSDGEAS